MTREEKEVIRRRFRKCLGGAKSLLNIMSRQTCTNPTYSDLLDITYEPEVQVGSDLCDWVGDDEADSAPEAGHLSATQDEEANGAPESDGVANAKGSSTTEHDFFCFAYEAADGAPGSYGVVTALEAGDGE